MMPRRPPLGTVRRTNTPTSLDPLEHPITRPPFRPHTSSGVSAAATSPLSSPHFSPTGSASFMGSFAPGSSLSSPVGSTSSSPRSVGISSAGAEPSEAASAQASGGRPMTSGSLRGRIEGARLADKNIELKTDVTRLSAETEAHWRFHERSKRLSDSMNRRMDELRLKLRRSEERNVNLRSALDETTKRAKETKETLTSDLRDAQSTIGSLRHKVTSLQKELIDARAQAKSTPRSDVTMSSTSITHSPSSSPSYSPGRYTASILDDAKDTKEMAKSIIALAEAVQKAEQFKEELAVKDEQLEKLKEQLAAATANAKPASATASDSAVAEPPAAGVEETIEDVLQAEIEDLKEHYEARLEQAASERTRDAALHAGEVATWRTKVSTLESECAALKAMLARRKAHGK